MYIAVLLAIAVRQCGATWKVDRATIVETIGPALEGNAWITHRLAGKVGGEPPGPFIEALVFLSVLVPEPSLC